MSLISSHTEIIPMIGTTGAVITVTGTTASVALPAARRGYRLSARNSAMYVELGGSGVTATSSSPLWLAQNESIDINASATQTHAAAIKDVTDGELRITPLD